MQRGVPMTVWYPETITYQLRRGRDCRETHHPSEMAPLSLRARIAGIATVALVSVGGCATPNSVSTPSRVDTSPPPEERPSAPKQPDTPKQTGTPKQTEQMSLAASAATGAGRDDTNAASAVKWDEAWRQLQREASSVKLSDHWRVCGIKFRFRNYQELFLCLNLIERRLAKLDKDSRQRKYSPVLIGWMRAGAYAELGQIEEARTWAESGWNALPREYREVTLSLKGLNRHEFATVAIEAGGSAWSEETPMGGFVDLDIENPAGLDMRPQVIAMRLAAQRSVLQHQLGEAEAAARALQDLYRWRDARIEIPSRGRGLIPLGSSNKREQVFREYAAFVSLGPRFSTGDYSYVMITYEQVVPQIGKELQEQLKEQRQKQRDFERKLEKQRTLDQVDALIPSTTQVGLGKYLANAFVHVGAAGIVHGAYAVAAYSDRIKFAVALEDASNELLYATSLARLGQTDQAKKVFDSMLERPEVRDMGGIYWAVLYERSQIAMAEGDRGLAVALLQQAVDAIERVRSTIAFEASKIGFAGSKQAVYASLVRVLAESGDWNAAFLVIERAKARALVDLLAARRELPAPPQADDKVRELLARAQINERQFAPGAQAAETRGSAVAARAELGKLAPEIASLISVQSVPLADIAARLAPDETLIDYFEADDDLYALVVNSVAVKGFKLPAKDLEEQTRAFRTAIENRRAAAVDHGRALYDRLIRPLANEMKGTKLTVSPHGVLHYLPFAALSDGERYLIDRYSLRVMPSASALVYLRYDKPSKTGRLLALGNPDLGDPRFDLPNAQQEALEVVGMFPASKALVRKEATKTAVKELGSSFSILHFASHGEFDASAPLSSGLLLAKGNESDGRLTVSDLYALRFDAELVTLSACDTGLGKVLSGDDVIGLTRGFLYAGARTVVASLWAVDDKATAKLMTSFYANLSQYDKREALRRAQIEVRKSFPQPLYWAAFEVTGSAN